jgi:hypothetical protein
LQRDHAASDFLGTDFGNVHGHHGRGDTDTDSGDYPADHQEWDSV